MNLEELKGIFLERFESPNEHEPYDSHEGGFYTSKLIDTEDAVAEIFFDLSDDVRNTLIGLLNEISTVWVKRG